MATPTTLPDTFVAGDTLLASELNNLRGAFRVLQVVQATLSTQASTTSGTFTSTGLTATITPISTSSKVLVLVTGSTAGTAGLDQFFTVYRGDTATGTNLGTANGFQNNYHSGSGAGYAGAAYNYLDSPATASAQLYTVAYRKNGSGTLYWSYANTTSTLILMEISA